MWQIKTSKNGVKYVEGDDGEVLKKECTVCGEMLKVEQFPKNADCLGGHDSKCKKCKSNSVQFSKLLKNLRLKISEV